MKHGIHILFLSLLVIFASCKNPKRGALSPEERTELERLVDSPRSAEYKFYVLAGKLSKLLDEAMAIENDEAAMAHLREFTVENDLALQTLAEEIDDWAKVIPDDERIEVILKLMDRPFAQQLRTHVPAFRRRIAYNPSYQSDFDALFGKVKFWR